MRVRYLFSSRHTGTTDSSNQHRTAYPKLAQDVIQQADIILQVLDIRFLQKTRNIQLEQEIKAQNKKLVQVINKADLVDITQFQKTVDLSTYRPFVILSCKKRIGRFQLRKLLKIEVKRLKLNRKAIIGIIGYPNTGKSSLTNILGANKAAPAGNKPTCTAKW